MPAASQAVSSRDWLKGLAVVAAVVAIIGYIEWRRAATPVGLASAGVSAVAGSFAAERAEVKAATKFQDDAAGHQAAADAHRRRADAAEATLAQVLEISKSQTMAVEDSERAIERDRPAAERALADHLADPSDLLKCQSTVEHQQGLIVDLESWKVGAMELAASRELSIKNYGVQVESLKSQVREQEEIAKSADRLARSLKRRKLHHGFGVTVGATRSFSRSGISPGATVGYSIVYGR